MMQALGTMIAVAGVLRLAAALIMAEPKQSRRPGLSWLPGSWRRSR